MTATHEASPANRIERHQWSARMGSKIAAFVLDRCSSIAVELNKPIRSVVTAPVAVVRLVDDIELDINKSLVISF